MSQTKPSENGKFTTIKVSDKFRRWLKAEAAQKGVTMYALVESTFAKMAKGRPWDRLAAK